MTKNTLKRIIKEVLCENDDSTMKIDKDGTKRWKNINGKLHREDGPAIEWTNGYKEWYKNGKLHREDGPAVEDVNGDKWWYKNGKLHREDGHAAEHANGAKWWYKNGKLHRLDGPAIEYANGDTHWYINGIHYSQNEYLTKTRKDKLSNIQENRIMTKNTLKRIIKEVLCENNDSTMEVDAVGTKRWYNSDGKRHREDGPAVEYADGDNHWFINDKLHREDGPAIENASGTKFWYKNGKRHREDGPAVEYANGNKEWYINGIKYSQNVHLTKTRKDKLSNIQENKIIKYTRE